MSRFNETEESINYFLQENKNEYCVRLKKENYHYRELQKKMDDFLQRLLKGKSKKKKFKLEDEFSNCFYELMHIESMYLYKQGFKDCYKIIQLLERE